MDLVALVREVGLPLALLVTAVAVLWRAWRLESRLREQDIRERHEKLAEREAELHTLYRELALHELASLVEGRAPKEVEHGEESDE